MALETLNDEGKRKLKQIIDEGIRIYQEIDDLKIGLKDTVKNISEELSIKPKVLNAAIRAAYKDTLDEQKETVNDIEEMLYLTGNRSEN